jgi:hypothetical protein
MNFLLYFLNKCFFLKTRCRLQLSQISLNKTFFSQNNKGKGSTWMWKKKGFLINSYEFNFIFIQT